MSLHYQMVSGLGQVSFYLVILRTINVNGNFSNHSGSRINKLSNLSQSNVSYGVVIAWQRKCVVTQICYGQIQNINRREVNYKEGGVEHLSMLISLFPSIHLSVHKLLCMHHCFIEELLLVILNLTLYAQDDAREANGKLERLSCLRIQTFPGIRDFDHVSSISAYLSVCL